MISTPDDDRTLELELQPPIFASLERRLLKQTHTGHALCGAREELDLCIVADRNNAGFDHAKFHVDSGSRHIRTWQCHNIPSLDLIDTCPSDIGRNPTSGFRYLDIFFMRLEASDPRNQSPR